MLFRSDSKRHRLDIDDLLLSFDSICELAPVRYFCRLVVSFHRHPDKLRFEVKPPPERMSDPQTKSAKRQPSESQREVCRPAGGSQFELRFVWNSANGNPSSPSQQSGGSASDCNFQILRLATFRGRYVDIRAAVDINTVRTLRLRSTTLRRNQRSGDQILPECSIADRRQNVFVAF